MNKRGFTLVELLLYIGLSATMLIVISGFLGTMLEARVKNQTIAEVEQQGMQVIHLVSQTIRNSEAITSPGVGLTSSSLTLDVVTALDDPTIFDSSSDVIRIKEGGSSAVSITNSNVLVSGLLFENLSGTSTPGVIRISFTLSHRNISLRNEFEFSQTFYTSASLREQ